MKHYIISAINSDMGNIIRLRPFAHTNYVSRLQFFIIIYFNAALRLLI